MSPDATAASRLVRSSSRQTVTRFELAQFFDDIGPWVGVAQTEEAHGSSFQAVDKAELKPFFGALNRRVAQAEVQQRRIDRKLATGFNVFDLIEPDENKLSDVLAILLDPNGSHGQGDLFLRLLFKQLGLCPNPVLTRNATVQREAPTYRIYKYRRRMDVLVDAGALLVVENKVDSMEQPDQIRDYLEHLCQCSHGHHSQSAIIYLTPDGRLPESLSLSMIERHQRSGRLHCWSYQVELRKWLEACRGECQAQRICEFLSSFITYIEYALKRESENDQKEEADDD